MSAGPAGPVARRRAAAAALLVATIALGLATHFALPDTAASDIGGDALYTIAIYLAVALLAPRARPAMCAGVAIGWSFAVEVLQLTDLPASAAAIFPPARLVLGSGFDPRDLLVYALAGAFAFAVDVTLTRIRNRRDARARPARATLLQ